MNTRTSRMRGAINGPIIAITALTILVIGFGAFGIWSYIQYSTVSTDVEGQISDATAKAVKEQVDIDEKKFAEREKQPLRQFAGLDDYGRLTFDYPKTWSAYQATDVSKGGGATYEAYLNPLLVPPVTPANKNSMKYALRVTIEQQLYDQVITTYSARIKKGDLQSSAWTNGEYSGTMLIGNFTKDIRGRAVIMKMRDRTLTVRTDADVFKDDYEALIKTIKFNQ